MVSRIEKDRCMSPIDNHPLRYALANELHARPFPSIEHPARAAFLALKPADDVAVASKDAERAHLIDLLDRYGATHPAPDATHYSGKIGKFFLKWESHTEFVTYTIFGPGVAQTPFDGTTFAMFPQDWLAAAPGKRVTSALIRVETLHADDEISQKIGSWMVPESVAVSRILDGAAVISGDFRIDQSGHVRFAVFVRPDTGPRRIGRIVQRLCEIETYKTMSMLGLTQVRALSAPMSQLDQELTELVTRMSESGPPAETSLGKLLSIAAQLEGLVAKTTFRFGATKAYSAIVPQRIEVLREERFLGRQTFGEFMARRYDPAMRTVFSTQERLQSMTGRAARAGDLLRTRVDVERQTQNQAVLERMDKRADQQLRLQRTVEGLSVVAISYYALNLLIYGLTPIAARAGIEKPWLSAGLVPVVVLGVWWVVRRIRRAWH